EAGGEVTESLSVTGTGWTASIEALEPDKVGIVNIPIDRLVIEGDEPAVERVHALIRRRTERRRRTKYE
ncbi:MAG: hypothetical protein JW966_07515, partial [Anaerolineae bacterium]|nr:hypothetical protein [Anaerolineae bacterium]